MSKCCAGHQHLPHALVPFVTFAEEVDFLATDASFLAVGSFGATAFAVAVFLRVVRRAGFSFPFPQESRCPPALPFRSALPSGFSFSWQLLSSQPLPPLFGSSRFFLRPLLLPALPPLPFQLPLLQLFSQLLPSLQPPPLLFSDCFFFRSFLCSFPHSLFRRILGSLGDLSALFFSSSV